MDELSGEGRKIEPAVLCPFGARASSPQGRGVCSLVILLVSKARNPGRQSVDTEARDPPPRSPAAPLLGKVTHLASLLGRCVW